MSTQTFDRAGEILAIARNLRGKVSDIDSMADRAIHGQWSLEDFRAACTAKLPTVNAFTPTFSQNLTSRDVNGYSISRALAAMANGKTPDGLEGEMSRELHIKSGLAPRGFWIPDVALTRNFVAGTATLGGNLVETSVASDAFIELLRNRAKVIGLGARVLNLTNPVSIPKQASAGAANWTNGETTAATLSTGSFSTVGLSPKWITGYQQYSRELLLTGNPGIDQIIRDDITQQIALAIDKAALHGAGSGGVPAGIAATTGVGTVLSATDGQALTTNAYLKMVSLETAVSTANADSVTCAYLIRPEHAAALKVSQRFANSDSPVMETKVGPDGRVMHTVNGYRCEVTNQIATNLSAGSATTIASCAFFGDFSSVMIGSFSGLDLVVDNFTLAQNGVVRVIARRAVDIGVRHPDGLAILGGIL
jgi:HK97 family phage major capsid protein